jgi:hypothetical protein
MGDSLADHLHECVRRRPRPQSSPLILDAERKNSCKGVMVEGHAGRVNQVCSTKFEAL